MSEPVDPKTGMSVRTTDAFFAIGLVFFVLGVSGDNNAAFLAIGIAFLAIGASGRVRKSESDR